MENVLGATAVDSDSDNTKVVTDTQAGEGGTVRQVNGSCIIKAMPHMPCLVFSWRELGMRSRLRLC